MSKERQIQEMKGYLRTYRILQREAVRQEGRLAELERVLRRPLLRGEGKGRAEIGEMVQVQRQQVVRTMEEVLERGREIEALIGRIEGTAEDRTWLYRQILGSHYLDGLTFARIADQLHYHERHVRRLHRAGLAAAVEALKKEGNGHEME